MKEGINMKELKKCPLCGNMPNKLIYSDSNYDGRLIRLKIECKCGLELSTGLNLIFPIDFEEIIHEMDSVIERWNNRK